MTTQNQAPSQRKDDEKLITTILFLFFGLSLLAVDFFYSDWPGMIHTWACWGLIVALIGHAAIILSGFAAYMYFDDPNYDWLRKSFIVGCVLAILLVGGFRAAKNEAKSVIDDSNQAKQEQAK